MKAIFIHGGPGLNSNPEQKLLKDDFVSNGIDIRFWNEPKEFQTKNFNEEILNSIIELVNSFDEKIILIGHSTGCRNILNILPTIKSKVHSICFLSPALDLKEADGNIIKFGMSLLEKTNPEAAKSLLNILPSLNDNFDENKADAILLGLSSGYFVHNFINSNSFENYFQFLQGDNQFRVDDYLKIRKSGSQMITESDEIFDIPTIALFGKKDPIFNFEHGVSIISKYFSNLKSKCLEDVSHYPHIDDKDLFFKELLKIT